MSNHVKKRSVRVALLCCACLCFSILPVLLTSCRDYDSIVLGFYRDTCDAGYNAIKLDLGKNNSGVFFIEEQYGIWTKDGEECLFDFDYVSEKHGGGELMIRIATQQSYYDSVVYRNDGAASFYKGEMVFSGRCEFSDDETIATISPDKIFHNEMSVSSDYTVTLTKTHVSDKDIIPFETALENMKYVPDAWFGFISNQTGVEYSCDTASFWVDGYTMLGEWNTSGSVIPIRMKLHEKVPYVEIYDISGSSEKSVLKSYAKVIDDSIIELVSPEGEMFYTVPVVPVTVLRLQSM